MREEDLLNHIYQRSSDLQDRFPAVIVGPGDDCAVVATSGGDALLLTVDHVVENRHFRLHPDLRHIPSPDPTGATLEELAHKAIARSVSDIAAMGGSPSWALATGLLPPHWPHADALFDAMACAAIALGCPLVGGDIAMWSPSVDPATKPNAIVLTVTAGGTPHEARGPVLRSGARPGDLVYVTGSLGGSLSSGRHLSFTPRLAEAAWLCDLLGDHLHAMIDISDGAGLDAARIGRASGCLLELDADALPLHPDVRTWTAAAADGEDYELLFTTSPQATLPPKCPLTGTPTTLIGRVVEAPPAAPGAGPAAGARIRTPEGAFIDAASLGWDHGQAGPSSA